MLPERIAPPVKLPVPTTSSSYLIFGLLIPNLPLELTAIIGTPLISLTDIMIPSNVSLTSNNDPDVPSTLNTVAPATEDET